MLTSKEFIRDLDINVEFKRPLIELLKHWRLKNHVDILVVVDTEISTNPIDSFGIASVIDLIRTKHVGCMHFHVDIALRNGQAPTVIAAPGVHDPKYRGFRFNMMDGAVPVLDRYEQVWCFGFKPSNSGNQSDAEVNQSGAFPPNDAELSKLAQWMKDRKGGLFGTGDHHFVGASMCKPIPRLGTMRRWTNADGVPTQFFATRIDTLRPPSPAYEPGAPGGLLAMSNTPHQGDLTVQPIQWVAWQHNFWPFIFRKRPHPVLCHPTLGPINVMPDHAHEGLCVESAAIALGATYSFDGGGAQPEYPDAIAGGPKPAPQIIAYGSNLGDPPYNFAKGVQAARPKNAMISVYDGHLAGVGRVATDSTWHHWMDVNIDNLKAANNDDWKKISRYFLNLAVWLTPPGFSTSCFHLAVIASHLQYPGFQEYAANVPTLELGKALRAHLTYHYGPCWVTDRIWELILVRKLLPFELLREPKLKFDFGRIDWDILEDIVLGHYVEATFKPAEAVRRAASDGAALVAEALVDPEKLVEKPLRTAINEFADGLRNHFAHGAKIAEKIRG